jgi:hypothetical protein
MNLIGLKKLIMNLSKKKVNTNYWADKLVYLWCASIFLNFCFDVYEGKFQGARLLVTPIFIIGVVFFTWKKNKKNNEEECL